MKIFGNTHVYGLKKNSEANTDTPILASVLNRTTVEEQRPEVQAAWHRKKSVRDRYKFFAVTRRLGFAISINASNPLRTESVRQHSMPDAISSHSDAEHVPQEAQPAQVHLAQENHPRSPHSAHSVQGKQDALHTANDNGPAHESKELHSKTDPDAPKGKLESAGNSAQSGSAAHTTVPPTLSGGTLLSVFSSPTRSPGDGFDENLMYSEFQKFPPAVRLSAAMREKGFRYIGHTDSASKANTRLASKTIRINKDLTPQQAALSLIYELKNASQAEELKQIHALLRKDKTDERAREYAEGTLRLEAKSILMRSEMAIALGREELVKNQRYNEIAKDSSLSDVEKEEATFKESLANGMVHQGSRRAYEHYVEQYWTWSVNKDRR